MTGSRKDGLKAVPYMRTIGDSVLKQERDGLKAVPYVKGLKALPST
jgi:hypothetical protein